jgi:hypothetical protein
MMHSTNLEYPIHHKARCYKAMYGERKKVTRQIDNESPVNYEQLYAQIIQKLKDE